MGRSIAPDLADKEVWFLTGSQTLYGDEVLTQVAAQSQQVVTMLDQSDDVACRVVWKPVLTSRDAILQRIREANAAPNVVGVITWMHTFSPAKMWIAGLRALDKPMLHLHTQANTELPWATIDFDFMNLNQAAHGDREFGYIETRLGIARTTVVGHASDPTVTSRIGDWCRAAAGLLAARNMSVARFGDNMRYVAVTEGDKTEAEAIFGSQINTWGVMDLASLVESASDSQIDALIEEYLDLYDVVPSLAPGAQRHDSLRYGAAIEVGLRTFLEDGGFSAFTTTFEDLGTLRQLPGLAVQRLMADGYGFGAEGDWKTAMLVRIAAVMGAGRPGGASLMEDYTYHMVPGQELSLGAHMLEVSPSLSSQRAAPRHRSTVDRRQGRSGAPRLHRRLRTRRGPRSERHARPFPTGGRGGRLGAVTRSHAQSADRSRGVAVEARLPHGSNSVARRRRLAPHCIEQPDHHAYGAGLRDDDRCRTVGDRRLDDHRIRRT